MTQPLTPAAQAVLDAAMYRASAGESDDYVRWIAAAVLRALARQREPLIYVVYEDDILAIAAELEGNHD